MAVLCIVELSNNGGVKKSSLEAVCFAKKLDQDVYSFSSMTLKEKEINILGIYGSKFFIKSSQDYDIVSQLSEIIKKYNINNIVFPKSNLSHQYAGRLSMKLNFSVINNIYSVPEKENKNLKIKISIFSGKAFSNVTLPDSNSIFLINKSSSQLTENIESIKIIDSLEINESNSYFDSLKILDKKNISGSIPLTEADIVVSAGRGMKGPENWKNIEKLATLLNAATACSKPVSDMGWRPHHEHVGQTGIKISPSLYIAVGISGAIQHLAGVGSSKVIVVINNDPDAPFFNSADYGIVGDAFEVVPKLISLLEKNEG
tara:strand:+ start:2888 stop:3835 length:948 start_codon:yes stop_codon:yes gene_type:complete